MADLAPIPLIPARRPRSEMEIIDVDALDDDDIQITGVARRSQRPRLSGPASNEAGPSSRAAPIIVLDSDEEMESSGTIRRPLVRRRHRLRSPPPRPRHPPMAPPPVPAVPAQFAMYHRHPPVVVPDAHPLPFEASMYNPRQRTNSPRIQSPQAAPRSHHQPVMGLGGALIALNRQNEMEELHRQNRREQELRESRAARTAGSHWRRHRHITNNWFEDYVEPLLGVDEGFAAGWFDRGNVIDRFGTFLGVYKPVEPSVAWKPSFTHPDKLAPGFTHNFDASGQVDTNGSSSSKTIIILDDEDLPSASSSTGTIPTLVCAHCSDSLVLSGSGNEAESKTRRIWALRCGHMLDGKCVETLMRPAPAPSMFAAQATDEQVRRDDPGEVDQAPSTKGKARAESVRPVRKGKGKAVDRSHLLVDGEETSPHPVPQTTSTGYADEEGNSIRSRLRSHRFSFEQLAPPAPALPEPSARPGRATPRRRGATHGVTKPGGRAKGKGRARKPQLLEVHEFRCPVADCGRVHRSILMTGEDWKMDPTEGAVALFV